MKVLDGLMNKKILMPTMLALLLSGNIALANAQENNKAVSSQPVTEAADIKKEAKKVQSDIVNFSGKIRYDIRHDKRERNGKVDRDETMKSLLRFRLDTTLNLAEGWKIKNRVDMDINYKNRAQDHFYNRMLYIEGSILGGKLSVGKIDYADFYNMDIAYGMIYDDYLKGGRYVYTNKRNKAIYTLAIGVFESPFNNSFNGEMPSNYPTNSAMRYVGIQAEIPISKKLMGGLAYHNIRSADLNRIQQIAEAAVEYKFDSNFKLGGIYAQSSLDNKDFGFASGSQEQAYALQLNYKGVKRNKPNSYGLWVAYRNMGNLATLLPTYTNDFVEERGYEVGGRYTIMKNLTAEASYFNGKNIDKISTKMQRWFGRLEYRF